MHSDHSQQQQQRHVYVQATASQCLLDLSCFSLKIVSFCAELLEDEPRLPSYH